MSRSSCRKKDLQKRERLLKISLSETDTNSYGKEEGEEEEEEGVEEEEGGEKAWREDWRRSRSRSRSRMVGRIDQRRGCVSKRKEKDVCVLSF